MYSYVTLSFPSYTRLTSILAVTTCPRAARPWHQHSVNGLPDPQPAGKNGVQGCKDGTFPSEELPRPAGKHGVQGCIKDETCPSERGNVMRGNERSGS
eukprot:scaffold143154_cov20-Tisochrysis_lutea.AAC.1